MNKIHVGARLWNRIRMSMAACAVAMVAAACDGGAPPPPVGSGPSPVSVELILLPFGPAVWVSTPAVPVSSIPIVGRYRLEISALSDCDDVPAELRRRTYGATLSDFPGEFGNVLVTLSEASFLQQAACHRPALPLSDAPLCNQMYAWSDDFKEGAYSFESSPAPPFKGQRIVEQLPGGAWLAVEASVGGQVEDRRITATGRGTLYYWSGNPVGSAFASCPTDLLLAFTRN